MKIEIARILIQKAFEDAETISHFKLKVFNILNQVYDLVPNIEDGYTIHKDGKITNQI